METGTEQRRPATKESNMLATVLTLAVFAGVIAAAAAAAYEIGQRNAATDARRKIALATELLQRERAPLLEEIANLKSERDALRLELSTARGIDADLDADLRADADLLARLGPLVCVDGVRLVKRGETWVRVGDC